MEQSTYYPSAWILNKYTDEMTDEELKHYSEILHAVADQAISYVKAMGREPETITIGAVQLKQLAQSLDSIRNRDA